MRHLVARGNGVLLLVSGISSCAAGRGPLRTAPGFGRSETRPALFPGLGICPNPHGLRAGIQWRVSRPDDPDEPEDELEFEVLEAAATAAVPHRHGSGFTVFADRHGPAAELTGLRQSFTAAAITHDISVDRRHGIVTLAPHGTTLRVGGEADEYARIRIVERSSGLIGMMSCSPDGTVTWRIPTPAADGACR